MAGVRPLRATAAGLTLYQQIAMPAQDNIRADEKPPSAQNLAGTTTPGGCPAVAGPWRAAPPPDKPASAENWAYVGHAVLHHIVVLDGDARVGSRSDLSPGVEVFPRLPTLEVVHPGRVERVGSDGQVETSRSLASPAYEIVVSSNEGIALVSVDFEIARNDQPLRSRDDLRALGTDRMAPTNSSVQRRSHLPSRSEPAEDVSSGGAPAQGWPRTPSSVHRGKVAVCDAQAVIFLG